MKSKIFLSVMLLSVLSSIVTKAELYQQPQETATQEQRYKQFIEQSKVMLTPEVATCFNNLGFYFYDDMGSEARTVYTRLQENAQERTPEFSYTTLIPALIQLVDLADKKSILERVAPAVQTYFAQLTAQEAKKHEHEKTRAYGSVYSDVPYVLNLLIDQTLQVGSYLAVNGVAVINKLAVLEALRLPANSICGDALIDNSVSDCKLQTITTPGKVANSATTATSNNIPGTIVLRDANGNFSAGTITANLIGNATTATTATNCINCPGASGTPDHVPNTLVQRDVNGDFTAGVITADLIGNATTATTAINCINCGASGYGYIYNLTPQTVAVEAPIIFDSNGPLLGVSHATPSDSIVVASAGIYAVTFSVSGTEPNQFAVFVNGSPSTSTVYGSGAGTQQNTGQAILTLGAGDSITIVNHSSAAAVGLASFIGGTQANVNASVLIVRLA